MDKRFFEQAAKELEAGNVDIGLMAKATALTEGDERKARAKYLLLRAEELAAPFEPRSVGEVASQAADAAVAGTVAAAPVVWKVTKIVLWSVLAGILSYLVVSNVMKKVREAQLFHIEQVRLQEKTRTLWFPSEDYPEAKGAEAQRIQYNAMLVQLESKHSPVNPSMRNYDPHLVQRIESRVDELRRRGLTPVRALKQAAKDEAGVVLYIPPTR